MRDCEELEQAKVAFDTLLDGADRLMRAACASPPETEEYANRNKRRKKRKKLAKTNHVGSTAELGESCLADAAHLLVQNFELLLGLARNAYDRAKPRPICPISLRNASHRAMPQS